MKNKEIVIHKIYRRLIVINCCLITFFSFYGMNVKCQVETLTIICNQNGAPAQMKLAELKSVMKGERQRWSSGTKVTVALMKTTTPIGKNTAQVLYNMSGDALQKYCMGLSFQGNVHAPKFFNTVSEIENYVAQNPGAIGVIDQPLNNNEVKVITIDGKAQFNL